MTHKVITALRTLLVGKSPCLFHLEQWRSDLKKRSNLKTGKLPVRIIQVKSTIKQNKTKQNWSNSNSNKTLSRESHVNFMYFLTFSLFSLPPSPIMLTSKSLLWWLQWMAYNLTIYMELKCVHFSKQTIF